MSPNRFRTAERRPLSSEAGSILMLTVLSMVVLLGVAALAVDGSYMYTERNRMAAAADAGAKSAAWELWLRTGGNLQAYANREVKAHGFNPSPGGGDTTVLVQTPPPDGRFAGTTGYVKVTVSRDTATFFGTILGWANLRPAASAVAGTSAGESCIMTLAPPGTSPPGLAIGNSTLTMPNCQVQNAGDIVSTNPGGQGEIHSAGTTTGSSGCQGNCSRMGTIVPNAPAPFDQFAGNMPAIPSPLTGCVAAPTSGTIGGNGACYTGLTLPNNSSVTLAAGTTYFTGPIVYNNHGIVNGVGVTLVLADGASIFTGQNSELSLSAPTSGAYNGVAIYQPATNHLPNIFQNSVQFNIDGAAYMPSSDLSFRNGFTSNTDCTLLVVRSFEVVNGQGNFNNACLRFGASPLLTVSLAE